MNSRTEIGEGGEGGCAAPPTNGNTFLPSGAGSIDACCEFKRERRSEIVEGQSADFNTDVRNSVAELFGATSGAAGMRGKGHVMIRMPPPGRIRGRKMASVPNESFLQ